MGGSWAGFFQGSMATLSIYNTSLTANQVQQNFNALRSRFGV